MSVSAGKKVAFTTAFPHWLQGLLGDLVFATGLIRVVVSGSELFTGKNLTIWPGLQEGFNACYAEELGDPLLGEDLDLRKIDLKKLDFTRDKIKFIGMYGDSQSVTDVTFEAE